MPSERGWGECRDCGAHVGGDEGVLLVVRDGNTTRMTVRCLDCATLNCQNCGEEIPLTTALNDGPHVNTQLLACRRCGKDKRLVDMVELRRIDDPTYLKHVCGDCLDQIAIPSGFRVIRDVSSNQH